MLCPLCHGHRLFYYHGTLMPCPECEGHGEIHCCDGLQEQPTGDDNITTDIPATETEDEPRDKA